MQNKHSFLFIILAIFIFYSCKDSPDILTDTTIDGGTNNAGTEQTDFFHPQANQVLISAHRGGAGLKSFPENALETMQYLAGEGLNLFEIDILETQDHELMLFHDSNLEKKTTGSGKVAGKTAEELRNLYLVDDFGNTTQFKMPYFKDVLKWGKEKGMYFMIDFKAKTSYELVIDLIREEKMEKQVALISYSLGQAKKLHRLAPEMMLSVSARNMKELNWILDTGIPTEKMIAFTGTKLSSQELYNTLKAKGIPVNLGTLGNLDRRAASKGNHLYLEWKKMGVTIFSTDRPIEVYKTFH